MEVTPIKKQSVAEQIYEQLRGKIISGELRPSDQLPTEVELCQMYQVSRTSVRQLFHFLVCWASCCHHVLKNEGAVPCEPHPLPVEEPGCSNAHPGSEIQ